MLSAGQLTYHEKVLLKNKTHANRIRTMQLMYSMWICRTYTMDGRSCPGGSALDLYPGLVCGTPLKWARETRPVLPARSPRRYNREHLCCQKQKTSIKSMKSPRARLRCPLQRDGDSERPALPPVHPGLFQSRGHTMNSVSGLSVVRQVVKQLQGASNALRLPSAVTATFLSWGPLPLRRDTRLSHPAFRPGVRRPSAAHREGGLLPARRAPEGTRRSS